ncbi:VWA domain-containing protein [Halostagnicola kamekurae]|uniref:VWA domain containing CoxE-like protein n=1 Tax=Halostagnicola kamekurae TaxID=619731 RepID=A0A1I6TFN3_9EURY|nr:VWA domain-containing protein [Halostagnicola kamekurae]SFS88019.1 hypothetical protein SAMN04488556_3082 [Halostagnicola kamekurae]
MYENGDHDNIPDIAGVRDEVVDALVTFARTLRRAGVEVSANAAVVGARALVTVGFDDEARARAALRAAIVTRQGDVETFDRMFSEFWRRLDASLQTDEGGAGGARGIDDDLDGALAPLAEASGTPAEIELEDETESSDERASGRDTALVSSALAAGPADEGNGEAAAATYSPAGRPETVTVEGSGLREEDSTLEDAVDRLVGALATLRGRRWERGQRGRRPDARRALRRSVATGGAIASMPGRTRRERGVRVLALVDVSRSVLDAVDRAFLLRFLRTLASRVRQDRVFFFDSEIRDVTAAFDAPTVADALAELERSETSWGGGTRIGHAVGTIRTDHRDAVDRRTVVFVVSDGLETGDVGDLERDAAWLSAQARAVLWLNPLAASPAYEPAAAGMAAALPFVDGLFAFTDADDVAELARQLDQYDAGSPIGYRYDPRRP